MVVNVNKLFEAWFYTMAFFLFYAGFHGEQGAVFDGIECVIYGTLVRCVDYVENL